MHQYVIVNAFSDKVLKGNPVAIFFETDDMDPTIKQRIAAEMRLSESTFISRPRRGGDAYVHIFTPVNELSFAGHPLLGTALALAMRLKKNELNIETAKGQFPFKVEYKNSQDGLTVAHVDMLQPSPVIEPYKKSESLLFALGLSHSTVPVEQYDVGPRHVFIGVENVEALSNLNPDQRALAQHENMAALCFCRNGDTWRMRMFSPAYGVVEDAATGSAAAVLALHLARNGLSGYDQTIEIWQGVEIGHPSKMFGMVRREGERYKLHVSGDAVLVAEGNYFI